MRNVGDMVPATSNVPPRPSRGSFLTCMLTEGLDVNLRHRSVETPPLQPSMLASPCDTPIVARDSEGNAWAPSPKKPGVRRKPGNPSCNRRHRATDR